MQRPPQSVQQMLANKDFVAQVGVAAGSSSWGGGAWGRQAVGRGGSPQRPASLRASWHVRCLPATEAQSHCIPAHLTLAALPATRTAPQILKNHILKGMVPTNNWPSALGLQYAKTYQSLGIAVPQLWVDARYTYQVTGWTGNNQVGCSLSNLQCGNGIMHVVTDSWQDAVNAGK